MELFIQLKDGKPFEHPILGNNFREAFPHIDTDNLPPEFARFVRVPEPNLGLFEVNEGVEYVLLDGIVRDVWKVRPMTPSERAPVEAETIATITAQVDELRQRAAVQAVSAEPEEFRQAWQEYKVLIDSWVLVDVETSRVPIPPSITPNGKILKTFGSGSVPNVIG